MKLNRTLIALSLAAALTTASAMTFASPRASEASIVGAWRTVVTLVNCQTGQPVGAPPIIGLSTFNFGGTMSEWGVGPGSSPAQRSPSTGVWHRDQSSRDYWFTFTHYRYDASGAFIGSQRVTADAVLARGGDSYDSIAQVEIIDPSNRVVANACATSVGTRIE